MIDNICNTPKWILVVLFCISFIITVKGWHLVSSFLRGFDNRKKFLFIGLFCLIITFGLLFYVAYVLYSLDCILEDINLLVPKNFSIPKFLNKP